MPAPSPGPRPWPTLIGLYLFAVAVNLVGIDWGLPGQARDLLPPASDRTIVEAAAESWSVVQDPARNLNFGPPDPDRSETLARTLRRFYLYTADPDEAVGMMAVARLNPLAGRWDPGFAQYGGFFLYALGATFKTASLAHGVTLRADPSFYLRQPEAMGRIYLVGRLLVVLVGALAIPLLWLIARPIYGGGIAAVAAGLAAAAPAWIAWNHVMKPVAFGAPFALATLAVGRGLVESARPWRRAVWAGILGGLAAGAALHYAGLLLGPWIASFLRRRETIARRLAVAAACAAAAALTVLAVQPYWLLSPARTIAAWRAVSGWYPPAYHPSVLAAFAWGSLAHAIGFPLVVVGLAEGLLQMWRRVEVLPLLAPPFAMLVAAAIKTGSFPGDGLHARLVLPAVLVLAMLGVGGLCRAARGLPRAWRVLPALLVLPTLVVSAALLANFVAAAGPLNSRSSAGRWLNTLPEGATIGVLDSLAPFRSPFFRFDRYRLVIDPHPERAEAGPEPEYFLIAERSPLPTSPAFLARYREIRRFAPPSLPIGLSTFAVYPFANPPIRVYARREQRR